MKKNDDLCSMTKSEERAFEILSSQLNAEKQERQAEQKRRRAAEARAESSEKENAALRQQLSSQLTQQTAMMSQLTQFLMGNGAVSLSESIKDSVVSSIRQEFEKREQEMRESYNHILAAKDNEINRLKNQMRGKSTDNDDHTTNSPQAPKEEMPMDVQLKQAERQKANLQETAYGQHTESKRYRHGDQQTEDADTLDLNGEDVPEEMICKIADRIKETKNMKGVNTPRREQPLSELAKGTENEIILTPENVPADAEELTDDVTIRYYWVEGYIRTMRIVRKKYKDAEGRYYQVNLPKEYQNCMGRTQITESLMSKILIMHFVYSVTISDIESWLQKNGLNFSHSTVIGWFRLASKRIMPMDDPLQDAIVTNGDVHSDETTLKCQDRRLPNKGEKEEEVEPEEHYFKRWLFCHYAPGLKLTQYVFYNRGRRTREAVQDYFKDVTQKLYVHSDGAPLYKCYDVGELIVRIACYVHVRRPLFKLKDCSEDANQLTDIINLILHLVKNIDEQYQDPEAKRVQRVMQLAPLLNELKSKLDILLEELDHRWSKDNICLHNTYFKNIC